jgi:hypothetical protein
MAREGKAKQSKARHCKTLPFEGIARHLKALKGMPWRSQAYSNPYLACAGDGGGGSGGACGSGSGEGDECVLCVQCALSAV